MAGDDGKPKQRSLSYRVHDALNVPLVGALSFMCIAGIMGWMDTSIITKVFTARARRLSTHTHTHTRGYSPLDWRLLSKR